MTEEADQKFVVEAVSRHTMWADEERPEWRKHFNAWDDNFWSSLEGPEVWDVVNGGVSTSQDEGPTGGTIHPTEQNLCRPYVTSHMASLYYDGVVVEVEPDELARPGETEAARARRAAAVEALANKWLSSATVTNVTERVLGMSLMFRGGSAYKVCIDPDAKGSPVDAVRLQAVPPWEAVWDRRTRTEDGLRYIGHLRQEPVEYVARLSKEALDDEDLGSRTALVDVVEHGFVRLAEVAADASYLWVLTLDNLVGEERVDDATAIPGQRSEFLVDPTGGGKVRLLRRGPSPYQSRDGRPRPDLVPFLAEPIPHRPWDAIAPLASTYTLNAELNGVMSVLAGQFRKDAPRRILTTDELDEETNNKLKNAADGEFIKVPPPSEGGGPLASRYHVLELGGVPDSTQKYGFHVLDGLDRTQTMSDLSRGKAGQYMRAETTRALVDYDQAFIGKIRKRSDVSIAQVVELFFHACATAMEHMKEKVIKVTIPVPNDDGTTATDVYAVTADDLRRPWKVSVIDSASAPGNSDQELATTQALIPVMMELAMVADPPPGAPPTSPTQQAFARSMFDHLATKGNLPPGMRFAPLKASAPPAQEVEPPPPPEPAMAAPPAPAGPPPVVDGALPPGGLAEGIVSAVEAGI